MNHVAYFWSGPLDKQWMVLPEPIPVYRIPMPAEPLRAMAEGDPGALITIKVGEYERDLRPNHRPRGLQDPQTCVWWYFWKGVR